MYMYMYIYNPNTRPANGQARVGTGGKSPVKSRGKTGGSRRMKTGIETWDTMLNTRERAVISQLISQKPQKVLIKSS